MEQLTVEEIGSFLTTRTRLESIESPPHREWDDQSCAALVILWSLLVYPVLDPDLRSKGGTGYTSVARFLSLYAEYTVDEQEGRDLLNLFREHDYIRFDSQQRIVAGTALLGAMDAANMYRVLRTSVLVRKWIN